MLKVAFFGGGVASPTILTKLFFGPHALRIHTKTQIEKHLSAVFFNFCIICSLS